MSQPAADEGREHYVREDDVREHDVRPWGHYIVLDYAAGDTGVPGYKVKRIVVSPGKRLSYQRHSRRAEHWSVVSGRGEAVLDGVPKAIAAGDSVDVPLECAHRIANIGTDDLVLIEVQHGDYFGEDDIVRLEDDFGRAPL